MMQLKDFFEIYGIPSALPVVAVAKNTVADLRGLGLDEEWGNPGISMNYYLIIA